MKSTYFFLPIPGCKDWVLQTFFLNFRNFVFLENHKTKNCDFLRKKHVFWTKSFHFLKSLWNTCILGNLAPLFLKENLCFQKISSTFRSSKSPKSVRFRDFLVKNCCKTQPPSWVIDGGINPPLLVPSKNRVNLNEKTRLFGE